jgi:ABC-2 type transport system permease protein
MNAIYVLWLRQVIRYTRSRARIVAALVQPMMFLVGLGFGFRGLFARAGQGDYLQFLVPGIVGMSIIFSSMMSGMELVWDRQFGFLKETLVAPVPRVSIMLGRVLGGATTAWFQGVLVLALSLAIGFRPESLSLVPAALALMFLTAILFSAFGLIVGTLITDMQAFPLVMNFLVMPLFFLSGAMFPLRGLPPALRVVTALDPLSYGIDAMRQVLIGASHFGLDLDVAVLGGLSLCFLGVGGYFFGRMEI